ncbi:MAG: FecR domain-containing protein [Gammaproteobacteria bacterium]|nr:FecR domain-containing protein [Gammaproteobacteria bacterium]
MSNVHQLRSEEVRYDEASLWIERLSEGLNPEEEAELQAWLSNDPANQALLEKMAGLWDKMDSLSRLSTLVPQPAAVAKPDGNHRSYFALAASVVLALSVLFWNATFNTGNSPQTAQRPVESFYETVTGEQQAHVLEDGTQMTLNTGSRIGVRYTSDARLLFLEAGEVHVQVAKDPQRPLSVLAGGRIIQAVGTAFSIEIKPGREIELVVTEGAVRVGEQPESTKVTQRNVKIVLPRSATVITAGQELVMGGEAEVVRPLSEAEIEVKLSWREGNLIFRGESLAEVVQEVERYTGVEFVFVDEDLKEVRVSGFFKAGDVEGMLAVLKENFGIEFQRESEHTVLLYAM